MKKFYSGIFSLSAIVLSAMVVASCGDFKKTSVVAPPSTGGKVDFTRYVALGNSLTAGYENGALYESAQQYSYPNLIAQQASLAMGTTVVFNQPLISDPGFGLLGTTPVGHLQIVDLSKNPPGIAPSSSASPVPTNATLQQPYNNLGIPGATLSDMTDTSSLSNQNPFFGIVLRNAVFGKSCVQQALALHPTFITIEIGDNDILGYATQGGTVPYNPPQYFQAEYTALIDTLLADAPTAKIAIANIPDVTVIPFVTTVPDSIPNPSVPGSYIAPFIVQRHHADGTLHAEPINAKTDYILLTAIDSIEAKVGVPAILGGTGRPLPDQFVLDSLEVATARSIVNQYNSILQGIANAHPDRIALVDVNSFLTGVAQHGYVADGMSFTSAFIQGGVFGLDGIHPTAQGYGILANQFITAINARFGSNIPQVVISAIPGSIVLAKSGMQSSVLPRIHYNDLRSVLQLFDSKRTY